VVAQKAKEQTKAATQKAKENFNDFKEKRKESKDSNSGSDSTRNSLNNSSGEYPTANSVANTQPAATTANSSGYNPATVIFGVTLEEAVRRKSTLVEGSPDIVVKCVNYLSDKVKEEGIFRLSGSSAQLKELKESFDRGEDVDLSKIKDEHVVAGLLKAYFRELPEPIFTRKLMGELKAAEQEPDEQSQIAKLTQVMSALPGSNRIVLDMLLKLLNAVMTFQDINKMSVINLSIVFSPTLGCPMEIMKPIITHYEEIFGYDLIQL